MKRCTQCNRAMVSNVPRTMVCCGREIKIRAFDVESPPKATTDSRRRLRECLSVCQDCQHRCGSCGTGCNLIKELDTKEMARPGDIVRHLLANGACPSLTESRFSIPYGLGIERKPIPDDCAVITACDQKFIRGAYFLAWTLLRVNDVRMCVYLDRVPDDDPHVVQMRSWGVTFRTMPTLVKRDVPFYQTWNKPACITDALERFERALWLDSDTSVCKSVETAFKHLQHSTFVAGHGIHPADNANGQQVRSLFGPPRRTWEIRKYPCAGVVGFARRHKAIVDQWLDRCLCVTNHRKRYLWNPDMYQERMSSPLKYHDQGILQDLLIDDTVDGEIWSHFGCRREGTVDQILTENYSPHPRIICHYGGEVKPFFGWPKRLVWGDPGFSCLSHRKH